MRGSHRENLVMRVLVLVLMLMMMMMTMMMMTMMAMMMLMMMMLMMMMMMMMMMLMLMMMMMLMMMVMVMVAPTVVSRFLLCRFFLCYCNYGHEHKWRLIWTMVLDISWNMMMVSGENMSRSIMFIPVNEWATLKTRVSPWCPKSSTSGKCHLPHTEHEEKQQQKNHEDHQRSQTGPERSSHGDRGDCRAWDENQAKRAKKGGIFTRKNRFSPWNSGLSLLSLWNTMNTWSWSGSDGFYSQVISGLNVLFQVYDDRDTWWST